jgi:hypothetical protein
VQSSLRVVDPGGFGKPVNLSLAELVRSWGTLLKNVRIHPLASGDMSNELVKVVSGAAAGAGFSINNNNFDYQLKIQTLLNPVLEKLLILDKRMDQPNVKIEKASYKKSAEIYGEHRSPCCKNCESNKASLRQRLSLIRSIHSGLLQARFRIEPASQQKLPPSQDSYVQNLKQ